MNNLFQILSFFYSFELNYHEYILFLGSAGCIFAEMLRTSPLFKGDCEISQLFCIFQILGKRFFSLLMK